MDSLIPAAKIAGLSQGMFVGSVSDNFDERIEQKIFHARIVVDVEKVKHETRQYVRIPNIVNFQSEEEMMIEIQANYRRIKNEINELVENETLRINRH
jgi:DNA-binding GntR family transcriptional regulator